MQEEVTTYLLGSNDPAREISRLLVCRGSRRAYHEECPGIFEHRFPKDRLQTKHFAATASRLPSAARPRMLGDLEGPQASYIYVTCLVMEWGEEIFLRLFSTMLLWAAPLDYRDRNRGRHPRKTIVMPTPLFLQKVG